MGLKFADVMGQLAAGQVVEDLDNSLAEVARAVEESGKNGTVTIKLIIAANGDHMVTFDADINTKKPKASFGKTLFYTDAEGGLHRRDPRQLEMPLVRDVSAAS